MTALSIINERSTHMLEPMTESHSPDPTGGHLKSRAEQALQAPVLPDLLLVERARCKDARAFEMLMRRYNQRLFRIARSILPDEDTAEHVVQEAYLLAFSDLERYEPAGKFGAWLARLAFNQALALRRNVRPSVAAAVKAPGAVHDSAEAEQAASELDGPEAREMLEHAIDELPEVFRTVFVLRATASARQHVPPCSDRTRRRFRAGREPRRPDHQSGICPTERYGVAGGTRLGARTRRGWRATRALVAPDGRYC
jgi:RNA polymerase sigma factor (sigma-70 family)